MRLLTQGVCLCVLSPQGRHSANYNEHMPMKELHRAIQPDYPGKFPYRPRRQGPDAAPMFRLTAYFVSWYQHSRDSNPKSSADRPVHIRITPWRLAISGPNLCPVTENRGWVVWPPHLLPCHSIITPIGLAVGSVSFVFTPISVDPWLLTIRRGAGTLPPTLRKA